MREIKLDVSVDEANMILEALGQLPFVKVYGLIGKIQEQARQQIDRGNGRAEDAQAPSPAPVPTPTIAE